MFERSGDGKTLRFVRTEQNGSFQVIKEKGFYVVSTCIRKAINFIELEINNRSICV
jgi:hypothetical protein